MIVVPLQNCVDIQKDIRGSYSQTCQGSCDEDDVISIKVEDVSDIEEHKDPVPLNVSGIKTEHEVSCNSVMVRQISHYPEFTVVFLIFVCLCT
jgi:hypothetical protein